jgi:hypothetical protein
MAPNGDPEIAFAMAWRIVQVVNTLVDLPMHVAIVKGLNKKLPSVCQSLSWSFMSLGAHITANVEEEEDNST